MDKKIEKYLVCSLIQAPKEIDAVKEIVSEQDFIDGTFKHAFMTILHMRQQGKEIDLPALYLDMGRPQNISILVEDGNDLVLSDPVHYALLLKQRNLENETQKAAKEREFSEAKEKIIQLESLGKPANLLSILAMIEKAEDKNEVFATGYPDIDKVVQFRATDLMIIAGRTSIGKSTLGLSILSNMARTTPTGMISFEMSPKGIIERLSLMHPCQYLEKINPTFFVSCPTAFTLHEVRKSIIDMQKQKGIKVVLVDYLQLMQEPKLFRSRHLEISAIIRSLKEMAKEFQIGMIVICQLSRGIDMRGDDAAPRLGDLKESGDIEHCADIALLLHRKKAESKAELIVAKNRYGTKGIVTLVWDERKTNYGSYEWREEEN